MVVSFEIGCASSDVLEKSGRRVYRGGAREFSARVCVVLMAVVCLPLPVWLRGLRVRDWLGRGRNGRF